jgi:hypothetical protein
MNIRMLKQLGVAAALIGSVMSATVANASIVAGSTVSMFGDATVTGTSVTPVGITYIAPSGNLLSFAGYNFPNTPQAISLYTVAQGVIPGAGPLNIVLLTLPAVVVAAPETGPAVQGTQFRLLSWTQLPSTPSFFNGTGFGVIEDMNGGFLSDARYDFSTQLINNVNSFSGTLTAVAAIPVPGAIWIFGSGLLLMTAVMRRKTK